MHISLVITTDLSLPGTHKTIQIETYHGNQVTLYLFWQEGSHITLICQGTHPSHVIKPLFDLGADEASSLLQHHVKPCLVPVILVKGSLGGYKAGLVYVLTNRARKKVPDKVHLLLYPIHCQALWCHEMHLKNWGIASSVLYMNAQFGNWELEHRGVPSSVLSCLAHLYFTGTIQ